MSNQHFDQRSKFRRTLAIFPGALGDFVCFLPALAELVGSEERPTLVCPGALIPLVAAAGLAEAVPLEGEAGAWLFSTEPPGEADDRFGEFLRIECFTGHGVPEVTANVKRWAGERGKVHPFRPGRMVHLATHFLECLGAPVATLPEVRLSLPGDLRSRAVTLLGRGGTERPLLLIQPGSGSTTKRWSRSGFAQVGRRWSERGGDVVVVLGPAESGERGFWTGHDLPTLQGLTLTEMAAALCGADVYLGNDSGASHLAAAVGRPGAVLFGPTDERLWRPLSPKLRVVRPPVWSGLGDEPPAEIVERLVDLLRRAAVRTAAASAVDKVEGRH